MAIPVLVIIDPQNDFTNIEGNYAKRHEGITKIAEAKSRISSLIMQFANCKKVIVRSNYRPDQFGAGLSMCIPGTFGHTLDADLQADCTCAVVTKTEHSCFSSKAFTNLLRSGETDTVIICGFLAEYCVKQTAADAINFGFRVLLVDDCIATGDDVQHRKTQAFAELAEQGAVVIHSEELYSGITLLRIRRT